VTAQLVHDPAFRALASLSDRHAFARAVLVDVAEAHRGEHRVLDAARAEGAVEEAHRQVRAHAQAVFAALWRSLDDIAGAVSADERYHRLTEPALRRHYLTFLLTCLAGGYAPPAQIVEALRQRTPQLRSRRSG
jgi:hypothetical protein